MKIEDRLSSPRFEMGVTDAVVEEEKKLREKQGKVEAEMEELNGQLIAQQAQWEAYLAQLNDMLSVIETEVMEMQSSVAAAALRQPPEPTAQ